ncbi:helix-turn-helix domain-containing protein [Nesterenkonia rhizosphaerae]|uniref:Helix-turn-helix domain-containing protein n=1 Tax=Nesterenkonia rhizosphaerae TaxID=1348272 RepID=A0ABP9FXA7_9MICC
MAVEVLGDRWTLVVLRDIIFGRHRRFRELQRHSEEGIASNVLADRLKRMSDVGLLSRHEDPSHQQKIDYRLTEPAIQLVPVLAQLGVWGSRWLPTTAELEVRAELLADGGPELWSRFMDELREVHLRDGVFPDDGVLAELTSAYQARLSALPD